jgi:Flp pilus assembly protein TadG
VKRLGKINNQNGAAMVEFAIVLPLLLMLIFGMIEFSIMLYDKAMLTNAAREGTRFGILFRTDPIPVTGPGSIPYTVDNYLQNNLISLGDPTVTWTTSVSGTCTAAGAPITVTVTYPYDFLVFPNIQKLMDFDPLSDTLTLSATTTMRCE